MAILGETIIDDLDKYPSGFFNVPKLPKPDSFTTKVINHERTDNRSTDQRKQQQQVDEP
jgi:hypothetical protein